MALFDAKAQVNTYDKYIKGHGSFEITDVLEQDNMFYLLCNQSNSTFDQNSSFLLKMNNKGDSINYYEMDISFHYVLQSMTKSLSGGLCFVGGIDSLESNFNFSKDGLFVETDYEGTITNSKTYRMSSKNDLYNILTDSTNYYVSGHKYISSNNMDLQVLKFDSSGSITDNISLDFRNVDATTSLTKAKDNVLISGSILSSRNDGYISMLNGDLDTLFFKKFDVFYDSNNSPIKLWYSYSSKFTKDSTILFPCVFILFNPDDTNDSKDYEHSGLIRTDRNGNFKSMDIYYLNARYDRPLEIFESGDGNYIIAGTINFANRGSASQGLDGDFYLMKVDTLGNILWFKRYGNNDYQEMKSVIRTRDGGFFMSGFSITNYTTQERTGYVVKTDPLGNITVGLDRNEKLITKIYPNPVSNILEIQSDVSFVEYSIFNLLGQKIKAGNINGNRINVAELTNGIYILSLDSKSQHIQVKFVKE